MLAYGGRNGKSSFRAVAQLIEPVFSSEYEGGVLELLLFRPGICGNVILLFSVFYIIAHDFSRVMEQIQRFLRLQSGLVLFLGLQTVSIGRKVPAVTARHG